MGRYSKLDSLCHHSPQIYILDISWLIQFIFSHAQVLAIAYGNFYDGPLDTDRHEYIQSNSIIVEKMVARKFSTILEFSTIMDFCVVQGNELSSADRVY